MDIYEIFKKINVYGPSGNEKRVRSAIEELVTSYADEIKTDTLGNLIARKKGPGKRLMISAHMDSIGLIATHTEENGAIRFSNVGGIAPENILGCPFIFENGTRASVHADGEASSAKLGLHDLFLDIGAKDGKEAAKYVKTGDMCVYDIPPVKTETDCVISPYNDNRICCAAQIAALSEIKNPALDCYFVFSVQEEVGCRGAKPSAYEINPDYGLACDVTIADDIPKSKHHGSCSLGKGAAIKVMDYTVISDPTFVNHLIKLAKSENIPCQRDVITAGGTDAGYIHMSRGGVKTSGISIPCRYTHSPQETISLSDAKSVAMLIKALCEKGI